MKLTLTGSDIYISKYVVRMKYNDTHDISIAIGGKTVITAWVNFKDDVHHTLDLSKYDTFPKKRMDK